MGAMASQVLYNQVREYALGIYYKENLTQTEVMLRANKKYKGEIVLKGATLSRWINKAKDEPISEGQIQMANDLYHNMALNDKALELLDIVFESAQWHAEKARTCDNDTKRSDFYRLAATECTKYSVILGNYTKAMPELLVVIEGKDKEETIIGNTVKAIKEKMIDDSDVINVEVDEKAERIDDSTDNYTPLKSLGVKKDN